MQPAPTNPSHPSEKTSTPCKLTHRVTATTLYPAYLATRPHPKPPWPTHRHPMDPSTLPHLYLWALPNPTTASSTQTTLYPNRTKGPYPINRSALAAASSLPLDAVRIKRDFKDDIHRVQRRKGVGRTKDTMMSFPQEPMISFP